MHDLAVAFDQELISDFNTADFGDLADVVATKVKQHQVLGPLLGIGEELGLKRQILPRRGATRARAGNGSNGHDAASSLDHDFREVQEIKIGGWIDAAQSSIEREWRQREWQLEALREHDLENIACGNVLFGPHHHALELGGSRVGSGLGVECFVLDFRRFVERPVQCMDDRR